MGRSVVTGPEGSDERRMAAVWGWGPVTWAPLDARRAVRPLTSVDSAALAGTALAGGPGTAPVRAVGCGPDWRDRGGAGACGADDESAPSTRRRVAVTSAETSLPTDESCWRLVLRVTMGVGPVSNGSPLTSGVALVSCRAAGRTSDLAGSAVCTGWSTPEGLGLGSRCISCCEDADPSGCTKRGSSNEASGGASSSGTAGTDEPLSATDEPDSGTLSSRSMGATASSVGSGARRIRAPRSGRRCTTSPIRASERQRVSSHRRPTSPGNATTVRGPGLSPLRSPAPIRHGLSP